MNDFTKEELLIILDDVSASINRTHKPSLFYRRLRDKIQSMIDNYCDCKIIKTMKDIDGTEIVDYCANCGKQR